MADAWDKFVDGAKDVVNSVADVAGGLYEKGKGYVNIKRVEAQLRDNYRLLGKLQYQAETGQNYDEGQKAELIKKIGDQLDELKRAGTEEGTYEFVTCKNCGAMISSEASYCPNCGVKVE